MQPSAMCSQMLKIEALAPYDHGSEQAYQWKQVGIDDRHCSIKTSF